MNRSHYAHSLRRKFSIFLHRWHRRIGVFASFFVIWMVISGWLLNHTAALQLAQRAVHSPILMQRYGLHADMPQAAFNAGSHWLVATPETMFLDGRKIETIAIQPIGMASIGGNLFIADNSQLILLGFDGAIIDKLSGSALPIARIEKIGSGCGGVAIASDSNYFVSVDSVRWSNCSGAVEWSSPQTLTAQQQKIIAPIIEPGISLERLLLDLHSGRFLGHWGPYFIDAVGLGLLVLALSGLWMYAQHARRRRHLHRHH
jgi:hypothetical protein